MSRLATAAEEYPSVFLMLSALVLAAGAFAYNLGYIEDSDFFVRLGIICATIFPVIYACEEGGHHPVGLFKSAFATAGVCITLAMLRLSFRPASMSVDSLPLLSAEFILFMVGLATVMALALGTAGWVFIKAVDRVAARIGVTA